MMWSQVFGTAFPLTDNWAASWLPSATCGFRILLHNYQPCQLVGRYYKFKKFKIDPAHQFGKKQPDPALPDQGAFSLTAETLL